ncbi:MAG: YbfB/YjiJ family MFS transporter [Desulfuromonadaceae bacterium]|nr:YbfB/YjiJ family MFS transporter [Desulfuromonadaceae bacterium]MDD5105367.1 YbfB/YjiJ family MFS transporter [Desulfuromonadaceae bacterium]
MNITTHRFYPWLVLAAGTMAVFSALGLARFGYSVLLPSMQAGLGLDNAQAGVLASANLIGYLVMALAGGALASHIGARRIVTAGLTLLGIGMIMTGMAEGFMGAAIWRAVTGIGSGAANIAVMGMWATWFPSRKRGLASGIAVTGSAFAMIGTGSLIPSLLARTGVNGWQFCWQIFGGLSLLVALICWLVIRNKRGTPVMDLSSPYAIPSTPLADRQHGSWHDVFCSKTAWHLGLVYVAFGFSYIIFMTFFVKHLIATGGYSKTEAGNLFMLMGWANLLISFLWGSLSDRIGRANTLVIIYLIHTIAFALFGLATSPVLFTLAALMFGMTAFSIPAIMAASCGDLFGQKMASAALGFVTLLFGIGQVAGPAIAGVLADRYGSFAYAYLLASVVALAGAFGSATLRSMHHSKPHE